MKELHFFGKGCLRCESFRFLIGKTSKRRGYRGIYPSYCSHYKPSHLDQDGGSFGNLSHGPRIKNHRGTVKKNPTHSEMDCKSQNSEHVTPVLRELLKKCV